MMSQAGNMGIALVVMWVVSRIPPQKLMSFAIPLYVVGIVLLIAVFLFGIKVNGARRWLSIGFTRVQPSEIMKIAMPLMLAWYFHKYEATLKLKHYGVAALLLLVPFALVAKQPDLGTALLIGAAGFYVISLPACRGRSSLACWPVPPQPPPSCGTCCTTTSRSAS
jgi:rod shape determining protein RodA